MRGVLLAGSTIIIAALVAYIFFPSERKQAAKRLEEFRQREEKPRIPDEDMEAEDAVVDEVLDSSAEPDSTVEPDSAIQADGDPDAEQGEAEGELE